RQGSPGNQPYQGVFSTSLDIIPNHQRRKIQYHPAGLPAPEETAHLGGFHGISREVLHSITGTPAQLALADQPYKENQCHEKLSPFKVLQACLYRICFVFLKCLGFEGQLPTGQMKRQNQVQSHPKAS
ncbi:mCG145456, partial [Mus musculus]